MCLLCVYFSVITVDAADSYGSVDDLYGEIEKVIPNEMQEDMDGILSADLTDSVLNNKYLINEFFESVKDVILPSLCHLGTMICILVIASIFNVMCNSLERPAFRERLQFLTKSAVAICIYMSNSDVLDGFSAYINQICAYMNSVVPAVTAIYAASGNITASGVSAGGLMIIITLIDNILAVYGTGLLKICIAFAMVSVVCKDVSLKILEVSKKALSWGFGVIMGIFALIMGVQTSLACSADSVSVRTIKFALGRSIPLIGGAISEAVSTVSASLSLIKNTCGSVVIIAIILMLLPMLAKLFAKRITLWAASFFSSLLDLGEEGGLINEFMSVNSYLIAFTAITGVIFIYVMTLFIGMTPAIAG